MKKVPKFFGNTVISGLIAVNLAFSIQPAVASGLRTQDIILSANGAAGANYWEYNAAQGQGWVQHSLNWQPGNIYDMKVRCVDNCQDAYKFEYRIDVYDGRIATLMMKATNEEPGLIRVQLTALTD